jgi:hypothetical protein
MPEKLINEIDSPKTPCLLLEDVLSKEKCPPNRDAPGASGMFPSLKRDKGHSRKEILEHPQA